MQKQILFIGCALLGGCSALVAQAQQRTTSWLAVANMTDRRAKPAAAAIGSKIYVWGGYTGSVYPYAGAVGSLETYDVATNTWTRIPGSAITGYESVNAVGRNGMVYVLDVTNPARYQRFDPVTNTATTLQAPALPHVGGKAATGLDGSIYVFGGNGSLTATSIYNPTTNSWTAGAPIPDRRYAHAVVRDAAGLMHLLGGGDTWNNGPVPATNVHRVYDPATNSWSTRAPLPALLFDAAAALGADGNIYVIGGSTSGYFNSSGFVSSVYIYSPGTDTWTNGPSLDAALTEAQAVTSGSSIYVLGGNSQYACMTCPDRQTTRVWQLDTSRPLATRRAGSGVVQVYPNPATDRRLTILATDLAGGVELRLYNALGQLVRREPGQPTSGVLRREWSLANLPAGVYTLQVQGEDGALTRRIVLP